MERILLGRLFQHSAPWKANVQSFQSCCGQVAGREPCWSPGAWTGHKLAAREPEAQDLLGRNGSAMQGMPASACTLRLPDTVRGAPVGHVQMSMAGIRTLYGFSEPVVDDSAWLPEMSKMHLIHIGVGRLIVVLKYVKHSRVLCLLLTQHIPRLNTCTGLLWRDTPKGNLTPVELAPFEG